jgi:pimeloyl-ACP methyl ester carboxylesterase
VAAAALTGAAARLLRAAGLLLLLSLAGCAWLVDKQHALALRPTPGQPAGFVGLRPGDERRLVPVDGNDGTQQLSLWWLPNADPAAPTLLYLHGSFRNLYQNLPKMEALRAAGFSIVAVDYRGWGDSTPIVPSEATIVADAWRAWDDLAMRQPDPRKRVIYGHSLGGTVAVMVASELRCGSDYGALALESTFTRLPDVAAAAGFWGRVGALLTTMEFDARSRIGAVDAPVWMLHGGRDRTVPVELGSQLRDAAPPGVHWVEFPDGTHSRLHSQFPEQYRQAFHDLIGQLSAGRCRTSACNTGAPAAASGGSAD